VKSIQQAEGSQVSYNRVEQSKGWETRIEASLRGG